MKKLLFLTILLSLAAISCDRQEKPADRPSDADYSLYIEAAKPRIFVAGTEKVLKVVNKDASGKETPVDSDITVTVDIPLNVAEYVNVFNAKYASDCILAPEEYYSICPVVLKAGESSVEFKVEADVLNIKSANSSKAYVLPICVTTDNSAYDSHDVKYVVFPTYTTSSRGNPVAHFSTSTAYMEMYFTEGPNDKALIFCPGGGYSSLSAAGVTTEPGVFNGTGMSCAYLHYTLPVGDIRGRYDIPTQDAEDALDIVWANAEEWGGYDQVGMIGRSAGGHLAGTTAAYHKDKVDFQVLLYAVCSMDIGRSHQGSVYQLLGDYPSVDLIKAYSTNLLVNPETPRAFVSYAMDDDVVPQEYNCYAFVQALKANGVEHVDDYHETGGHSTGAFANYPSAMIDWLKSF